jgi:hypothetical protein
MRDDWDDEGQEPMSMTITPVAGSLGAEIGGIDLRDPDFDFDAVQ